MSKSQAQIFDFYSQIAYPGPKARATTVWAKRFARHLDTKAELLFLDAGCGAAAHSVGLAQIFPNATIIGIDGARSSLEKGRGAVATVLFQEGTLNNGDHLVVGQ